MDRNYQPRLDSLVNDLEAHRPQAAAALLRDEIMADPQSALQMVRDAQNSISITADKVLMRNGTVFVTDPREGTLRAGHVNLAQGQEYVPAPVIVPVAPPYGYGTYGYRRPGIGLALPLAPGVGVELNIPLFGHMGRR